MSCFLEKFQCWSPVLLLTTQFPLWPHSLAVILEVAKGQDWALTQSLPVQFCGILL